MSGKPDDLVVRKGERGWVVGEEEVADLTSAMVLADLLAAEQGTEQGEAGEAAVSAAPTAPAPEGGKQEPAPKPARGRHARPEPPHNPTAGAPAAGSHEEDEAARLAVTVAQLEHALASRVGVEQAIGVLAERHRLRPREAFNLLRRASRSRGRRLSEMAKEVVASTANPLLRLPDELARELPTQRQHGRSSRRSRRAEAPQN